MTFRIAALLLSLVAVSPFAATSARDERTSGRDERIARAMKAFEAEIPARFFEEAHGYVVLPSIKRVGLGLGAAWGGGAVFVAGEPAGRARFWQLSSGIQTGARTVRMIVFFRNEEAMEDFERNRLRFMGQTGFALFGWGHAITPGYHSDVAIFTQDGFGLMIEASIAGAKLGWRR